MTAEERGEEMEHLRFTMIESFQEYVPEDDIIKSATPEIKLENRRMLITGYCILVQHPTLGNVLYDCGVADDWETTWNDTMKELYSIVTFNSFAEKLRELGLTPDDIDILIISHLHYDHAGNIKQFQNTKAGKSIIVSEADATEAFVKVNLDDTGYSGAYWKPEFLNLPGIGYRLLKEDTRLADDVELFIQRGHTPGVLGMVLYAESGTYIFTSDGIYSSRNYGPPVTLPGLCFDPDSYSDSVEKVRALQKQYGATVVFSHDVADIDAWRKSPFFYT